MTPLFIRYTYMAWRLFQIPLRICLVPTSLSQGNYIHTTVGGLWSFSFPTMPRASLVHPFTELLFKSFRATSGGTLDWWVLMLLCYSSILIKYVSDWGLESKLLGRLSTAVLDAPINVMHPQQNVHTDFVTSGWTKMKSWETKMMAKSNVSVSNKAMFCCEVLMQTVGTVEYYFTCSPILVLFINSSSFVQ